MCPAAWGSNAGRAQPQGHGWSSLPQSEVRGQGMLARAQAVTASWDVAAKPPGCPQLTESRWALGALPRHLWPLLRPPPPHSTCWHLQLAGEEKVVSGGGGPTVEPHVSKALTWPDSARPRASAVYSGGPHRLLDASLPHPRPGIPLPWASPAPPALHHSCDWADAVC